MKIPQKFFRQHNGIFKKKKMPQDFTEKLKINLNKLQWNYLREKIALI